MSDQVNHPRHYTSHPSGIECIWITEHMWFCLGNAIKYISKKENMTLQELHHAILQLNQKQQDLFASNLESIFLKNNPLWDGPLMLIPVFAFESELNEALLKATGIWEERG
jgi:hypothetical protein